VFDLPRIWVSSTAYSGMVYIRGVNSFSTVRDPVVATAIING